MKKKAWRNGGSINVSKGVAKINIAIEESEHENDQRNLAIAKNSGIWQ